MISPLLLEKTDRSPTRELKESSLKIKTVKMAQFCAIVHSDWLKMSAGIKKKKKKNVENLSPVRSLYYHYRSRMRKLKESNPKMKTVKITQSLLLSIGSKCRRNWQKKNVEKFFPMRSLPSLWITFKTKVIATIVSSNCLRKPFRRKHWGRWTFSSAISHSFPNFKLTCLQLDKRYVIMHWHLPWVQRHP